MIEGRKYDKGKLRFSLFPQEALWGIIEVLEHGAAKYAVNNWMHVEDACTRYFDALHRHLAAMERGELMDPDSGLPHAWHMCCSAIIAGAQYMADPASRRQWIERAAHPAAARAPAPAEQLELPVEIAEPDRPAARCEHVWDPTPDLQCWTCTCGALVKNQSGRYVRFDPPSEVGGQAQFRGTFSTFFQATHLP